MTFFLGIAELFSFLGEALVGLFDVSNAFFEVCAHFQQRRRIGTRSEREFYLGRRIRERIILSS